VGLTQASFGTTLTSTDPHLVSVVVGLGWHPAEQCSAVKWSKSRGPVGDLSERAVAAKLRPAPVKFLGRALE
jgi:hypothetical protein